MSITFVIGGTRSGKSSFSQKLAEQNSDKPVYLATSRIWDADFKKRVDRHRSDRGDQWITIEEEKQLHKIDLEGKTVVLDCITLWLTNIYHDFDYDLDQSLTLAKEIWDQFIKKEMHLIVVSNELGMSIHPESEVARKFTDLQGWMNQYIASNSDNVYTMTAGIPVKIK